MSGDDGLWCRFCGPEHPLRIEMRLEAAELGTYSLSGMQPKVSASRWPHAVCNTCGRSSRGRLEQM